MTTSNRSFHFLIQITNTHLNKKVALAVRFVVFTERDLQKNIYFFTKRIKKIRVYLSYYQILYI